MTMPNFGRSYFPRSYLDSAATDPGTLGRSLANSSDVSLGSHMQSDDDEQQFVLSGANTPAKETAPMMDKGARKARIKALLSGGGGILAEAASRHISTTTSAPQTSSTKPSRHNRTRPIAIELPAPTRKINTAPTPPEPLSARGDLPGGYFPLHEDPKTRVHRPHPFHLDAQKARSRSISLAAQSCSPQDDNKVAAAAGAMSDSAQYPLLDAISKAQDKTHTPVTSYLPSGHHDVPLPMGKYYPSNYESRTSTPLDSVSSLSSSRPVAAAPKMLASPQTSGNLQHLAIPKHSTAHFRSDSDAKRRLQQYQRDMVAQAALGAREVIGGAAPKATAAASAYGVSIRSIQLPTAKIHKPTSPRLAPLGSPGPVTPMDLEENGGDGGYLTRGHVLSSPDAEREQDEVKRAMRADEERRRREGTTSPAIELGAVIF